MKLLAILTMLTLVSTLTTVSTVNAQNMTGGDRCGSKADFCYNGNDYVPNKDQVKDNGCPKHGFASDADFCKDFSNHKDNNDKGVYACNVQTDTDKFCKENLAKNEKKAQDNNKDLPAGIGKITVSYGDLGGYSGKAKIVIKNEDTGKILVTHDLNFAKLRASEGNDCCYKVYTFDRKGTDTHKGDTISAIVTGGGGSWDSGAYSFKKGLHIYMTLDEIGE